MNIRPVTRRELADFIRLPGTLYRQDRHYIEPLRMERRVNLSKRNAYFAHAEAQFFIAYHEDGEPIGRISAQIDTLAQREGEPRTGHFGLLDAKDTATATALLAAAENWLRKRGMQRVRGPFSLSINDESGLLIGGWGRAPAMMMNYAPDWVGSAVEASGYRKAKDLYAYWLSSGGHIPESAARMAAKALDIPGLHERTLNKRDYANEIARIIAIYNEAWRDNWGFVPMTDAEAKQMAKQMKPLLKPELARIVEINGEPAAMIVALPDANQLVAGLSGRLLPLGWAKLLWRLVMRPPSQGRVLLMGVRPQFREGITGAAIATLLVARLHGAAAKRGMKELELSWILEDNEPVKRVIELVGGVHDKTYRIYEKQL